MVLPPSGSDELIFIQTDTISITLKGKSSHPIFQDIEYPSSAQMSKIKVTCKDNYDLSLKGETVEGTPTSGIPFLNVYPTVPLFYEQQRYEVIIESSTNHTVEFWHDNLNIRNKITQVGRSGHILSGIINFGNEIGYSDLVILVDGKQYLRLVIEIFPTKISYWHDYRAILEDVTREIYNVVFDFLKKTYLGYQQSRNTPATPVEFFSVLQKIYVDFIRAADLILAQPHHILEQTHEVLPSHKIKKIDSRGRRWIERHPGHVLKSNGQFAIDRAMATRKQVTYDTRENRFTKYILLSTAKKLSSFKEGYLHLGRSEDTEVTKKIDLMIRDLNRRASSSLLANVGDYAASSSISLVFSMAPGYRDLYKFYLMLLHGLSISGDVFDISVKDLALLYEYWCFIKLNSLLKDQYQLISQDIVRVHGNGLYISLVKGSGSKVKYRNPTNGETITLSYNPKLTNLPTGTQRPDNVLTLTKMGSHVVYEYVFDAKYRINPALPGTDYYMSISHQPGPEVGDINSMHRYRDAIVYQKGSSPSERRMFGAYVLFPYSNEREYVNHRFYKSIEKVNIGGLPFLPSSTTLVQEMLASLIADSPDSAFERATLPRGIEKKLAHVDWSRRDVLVGGLHERAQLDYFLGNKYYDIPASCVPDDSFPIHYVALYQSKRLFGLHSGIYFYGEVVNHISTVDKHYPCTPLYRFYIKEWKRLSAPVAVKEIALHHLFTNLFLLQNSSDTPGLMLRSADEYRLFHELKRAFHRVDVELNVHDSETGFLFKDFLIVFESQKINVYHKDSIIASHSVDSFRRKPGAVFRRLQNELKTL